MSLRKKKYKRWTIGFLALSGFLISGVYSLNYFIDPFDIFGSGTERVNSFMMNERVRKIDYLDKAHEKYDSYLFGSSRIGTTDPELMEKYLPGSSFYNFTMTTGNMVDYIYLIRYMLEAGYAVKNLLVQLDIQNMDMYGFYPDNPQLKHHYRITGTPWYQFYFDYMKRLPLKNWRGKLVSLFAEEDHRRRFYEIDRGRFYLPDRDRRITEDPEGYIAETWHPRKTHYLYRNLKGQYIRENIALLRELKSICFKNGINLILYVTPHNYAMMNRFDTERYLILLRGIASVMPFWDFSGYNTVTLDNRFYYEYSHYRTVVSELMAARIFGDDGIDVPDDFGYYVNRGNIEGYIEFKRKEIEAYEGSLGISGTYGKK